MLSGKTTADSREVDVVTGLVLRPSQGLLKPLKECFARRPRERTLKLRFFVPGSLSDEEDAVIGGTSHYRRANHVGTLCTFAQRREVLDQCRRGTGGRGGRDTELVQGAIRDPEMVADGTIPKQPSRVAPCHQNAKKAKRICTSPRGWKGRLTQDRPGRSASSDQ